MVNVKCTGAALCRSTGLLQPPYFLFLRLERGEGRAVWMKGYEYETMNRGQWKQRDMYSVQRKGGFNFRMKGRGML